MSTPTAPAVPGPVPAPVQTIDALGARNVDAEALKPKFNRSNTKTKPDDNGGDKTVNPAGPSKSFLIAAVSLNYSFIRHRSNQVSTFVPSARSLFVAIDAVYKRLTKFKGFKQSYLTLSPMSA